MVSGGGPKGRPSPVVRPVHTLTWSRGWVWLGLSTGRHFPQPCIACGGGRAGGGEWGSAAGASPGGPLQHVARTDHGARSSSTATGWSQWTQSPPAPSLRQKMLHWSQRCWPRYRSSQAGHLVDDQMSWRPQRWRWRSALPTPVGKLTMGVGAVGGARTLWRCAAHGAAVCRQRWAGRSRNGGVTDGIGRAHGAPRVGFWRRRYDSPSRTSS